MLPAKCRFALTTAEALGALQEGAAAEAVRLFHEALCIYPSMTGVVKELLRQALRRLNDPALQAGEEFRQLSQQMKTTLRTLLSAGQTDQAAAILEQLLPLMPEDLELIRIRQILLRRG